MDALNAQLLKEWNELLAEQSPDCLLAFVDEVGDENLPEQQRHFGLASLVATKAAYLATIKPSWAEVREIESFHANKHYGGRRAKSLRAWLQQQAFHRVGVAFSNSMGLGVTKSAI